MKYILPILLLILTCTSVSASVLKPFTSDGCSSFPDGTIDQRDLWLKCCTAHDMDYWVGGSREQRKASDERLKECVTAVGEPEIAQIMLAGVRVGGTPYLPTTFRWGYGWPFLRGYKELSDEEEMRVDSERKKLLSDGSGKYTVD